MHAVHDFQAEEFQNLTYVLRITYDGPDYRAEKRLVEIYIKMHGNSRKIHLVEIYIKMHKLFSGVNMPNIKTL